MARLSNRADCTVPAARWQLRGKTGPSVGLELSQACRPFGSGVTIIEAGPDRAAEQVPGCVHTLYRRSRLRTVSECHLPLRTV